MQQGIKKLQWLEYLKVVFLEILNPLLCRVFANQVTFYEFVCYSYSYSSTLPLELDPLEAPLVKLVSFKGTPSLLVVSTMNIMH